MLGVVATLFGLIFALVKPPNSGNGPAVSHDRRERVCLSSDVGVRVEKL
jgi:hypothetical protein